MDDPTRLWERAKAVDRFVGFGEDASPPPAPDLPLPSVHTLSLLAELNRVLPTRGRDGFRQSADARRELGLVRDRPGRRGLHLRRGDAAARAEPPAASLSTARPHR